MSRIARFHSKPTVLIGVLTAVVALLLGGAVAVGAHAEAQQDQSSCEKQASAIKESLSASEALSTDVQEQVFQDIGAGHVARGLGNLLLAIDKLNDSDAVAIGSALYDKKSDFPAEVEEAIDKAAGKAFSGGSVTETDVIEVLTAALPGALECLVNG
ncbi:hypothetical protein [Nocardia sp. NPDC052316]|uniref:hypothetical protein n=1 Tax=Nocardia sp. NPDC052316 TaxID=3364329 RepID=UPI0037C9A09A